MLYIVKNKKPYDNVIATVDSIESAIVLADERGKVVGSRKGDRYPNVIKLEPLSFCDWLVTDYAGNIMVVPSYDSHEYWQIIWSHRYATQYGGGARRIAEKRDRRRRGHKPIAYLRNDGHTKSLAHNMRASICDDDDVKIRHKARDKNCDWDYAPWKRISKSWKDQSTREHQWRPIEVV